MLVKYARESKTTANFINGEAGPEHASARQKHVPLTEGQVDSSAQSLSLLTAGTNLEQRQLDSKGESGPKIILLALAPGFYFGVNFW